MKKWILGLSAVAAVATPVVAVVSCGKNTTIKKTATEIRAKKGEDHSQEFDTIKADGTVWNQGVAFHSSSQGISYLMNIAKELGWTEPADQLDFTRTVEGYTARTEATALEKAIMADPVMKVTDASLGLAGWADGMGIQEFIDREGNLDWASIPEFNEIVPATDANKGLAMTHYSAVLPAEFKTADAAAKTKLFCDALLGKNHLIPDTIGSVARKVLFQIDETTNTLHIWLGAESEAAVAALGAATEKVKNALNNLPVIATPATPAASYRIDPVGSDGSMDPWWFSNNTTRLGFDLGNTKDANNANNSFGLNTGDGNFANLGRIGNYQAMLDAKRPGSTIIRAWVKGIDHKNYVKTWHSNDHVVRTYPKATDAQVDEISKLTIESIANIKSMINDSSLGMLSMVVNDSFINLIKWIVASNLTEEKVKDAVVALNNFPEVAHHIDAVLGFFKGWKNIPAQEQPGHAAAANLEGLSSISDPMDLINWFKMTSNNHDYVKAAPAAPAESIY